MIHIIIDNKTILSTNDPDEGIKVLSTFKTLSKLQPPCIVLFSTDTTAYIGQLQSIEDDNFNFLYLYDESCFTTSTPSHMVFNKDQIKEIYLADTNDIANYKEVLERSSSITYSNTTKEFTPWRAKPNQLYYYVDSTMKADRGIERNHYLDTSRFEVGNYFSTLAQAKTYAERLRQTLKD